MNIWRRLISILSECYSWKNIGWQFLAVIATYLIVASGFDWYYYTHVQGPGIQNILFPAVILGAILPVILPAFLFLIGEFNKNTRTIRAGFAVSLAALTGLLVSSFYKIFTGRIPPPLAPHNLVDISRQFEFGFLRDGIFWGWPSSHTTVAFAVAVTLALLYRRHPLIKYSALLFALYIGIGVSVSIHWFSECIAGAIIGSVIGVVIGRSFNEIA